MVAITREFSFNVFTYVDKAECFIFRAYGKSRNLESGNGHGIGAGTGTGTGTGTGIAIRTRKVDDIQLFYFS